MFCDRDDKLLTSDVMDQWTVTGGPMYRVQLTEDVMDVVVKTRL